MDGANSRNLGNNTVTTVSGSRRLFLVVWINDNRRNEVTKHLVNNIFQPRANKNAKLR